MFGLLMDQSDENGFRLWLIEQGLSRDVQDRTLYRLKKFIRSKKVITKQTATEWIVELLSGNTTAGSVNQYVQVFKRWCRYTKQDWAFEFKKYKEERHIPQTFSNDEIKAFLSVHTKWDIFWQLCIFSGARTGEIKDLTIHQVDLGGCRLLFQHTKTKTPRTVPLHRFLISPLQEYIQTLQTQYLFPARDTDGSCTHAAYMRDFRKRLAILGITRPLTPYNFRNTAITRWLTQSELNLFEIMRLVGHKSPETTLIYYQFSEDATLLKGMQSDSLVRHTLSQDEQFEQIKKDLKNVSINPQLFTRAVSENEEEIIVKVRKKVS